MHSLTNRVYQRKLLQSKIHAIIMVRLSRAGILMFCLRIFPAKKISSAYSYLYRRCWGQVEFPLINQKPVLYLQIWQRTQIKCEELKAGLKTQQKL